MRRLVLVCVLLSLTLSVISEAQPSFAGQPFPLTNTRYGTERIWDLRLVTDGRDFFLFWAATENIRMTRMVPGERRAGIAVVPVPAGRGFDVVWTGQHFLVAANDGLTLIAQLLTAAGERVAGPLIIAQGGYSPRLASNGSSVVVLFRRDGRGDAIQAATISRDGRLLAERELLPRSTSGNEPAYEVASNGDGFAAVVARGDANRLIMLDRDGSPRSEQTLGKDNVAFRIAGNGTGYVITARVEGPRTLVTPVGADGTIAATAMLGEPGFITSLVWTGSEFAASLWRDQKVTVAHLDASGGLRSVEPGEIWIDYQSPRIAAIGQRVMTAWIGNDSTGYVAEAPFTTARQAVFGAATQKLLATAAGDASTLFVWLETMDGTATLRAGTRAGDGTWNEVSLAKREVYRAVAASNGSEFAVLVPSNIGATLHRIGSGAQALAAPLDVSLPFVAESMVWNGQRYVAIGNYPSSFWSLEPGNAIAVASLTEGGVLSPASTIRTGAADFVGAPRLAWNGTSYLAIWHTSAEISGGFLHRTEGVRLGANLQRIGAADIQIGDANDYVFGDVVWDGSQFVVIHNGAEAIRATRVSSAGLVTGAENIFGSANASSIDAAAVAGGVAVAWHNRIASTHHVATLRQGTGTVVSRHPVLADRLHNEPRVAAFPQGRAIFVASVTNDVAPHHGALRLIAAVLDLAPLAPLTTAPQVTVRATGTRLRIEWTALAQPVTGYRVEYRIGDGNWNELERSPDAEIRTATFTGARPGVTYAFRVRGMSDSGMGPYSQPAVVYLGKRRSVR